MNERDMPELTPEEMLNADEAYREWSETIEQQNREIQDKEMQIIDLSHLSMEEVIDQFSDHNSQFHKDLGLLK